MISKETELKVQYTCVDGMHFFVSGDALTKGLCAANDDLKVAFDEVAVQLNYLFKKNHKVEVECTPESTFEEFEAWLEATLSAAKTGTIKPVPGAVIGWAQAHAVAI